MAGPLTAGLPPGPRLTWAWRAGPRDAEPGHVESRVALLATLGCDALLVEDPSFTGEPAVRLRQAAARWRLAVVDTVSTALQVQVQADLSDAQVGTLARSLVARPDVPCLVCRGADHDAAAIVGAARRLRRQIDRLAWARFQ